MISGDYPIKQNLPSGGLAYDKLSAFLCRLSLPLLHHSLFAGLHGGGCKRCIIHREKNSLEC
jgi:hypothetical protein